MESRCFGHLLTGEALAADGDALLTNDGSDTGLRDAVAIADLLGGLAGFVPLHDVGDIFGGQEAFRARFRVVLT